MAASCVGTSPSAADDARALLMTDVVDSTRVVERLGDAAAAALWAAHDRAARDLLRAHRGREIDRSDGLLLLFDAADDAARCALAYHQALQALDVPLQARAALHVGNALLRRNGAADVALGAKPLEVDGLGKAIAARLLSIGHGGQTLLSAAARAALRAPDLRTQSHGHWRLKGVAEPVEVFELGPHGAAFTPPADAPKAYRVVRDADRWLPARRVPHRLPAERDAFVGREAALDQLAREWDAGARLVTVTGMGGAGKTRLATHFGWTALGEFPGGVWFCDLSPARSAEGICHAVAQALDVPLGKDDAVTQLAGAIDARGPCLLVLDNFEQVAAHAEATLGHWLDACREARFLVTSRGVLRIPGESVLALAPLGAAEATALFLRRAHAARPGFEAQGDEQAAVQRLVHLLEGLPLAIELAAARVRVMSPRMLLARMSERFRLLSGTGARHDRQSTLRATFDWSWDLLAPAEKAALAQLSVFEGGFTLEAAEAVLDFAAVDAAPWPVDVVQSLVEQSFVRPVHEDRLDLLASVQAYALEHLATPGRYPGSGAAAARRAEQRHARHFASLDEARATARRCIEMDNLVAACRRATAQGDAAVATAALEGAWAALQLRGPFRIGLELAARVREMPGLPAACTARALRVQGRALQALGRMAEARDCFETALAQAQGVGDRASEARLLSHLGRLHAEESRMDPARHHLDAALELARQVDEPALQCEILNGLGTLDGYCGRLEAARTHYIAALALARRIGERRWEGGLLANLGNLEWEQGRLADARAHYEAGLVVARELGNRQWEGNTLCNLGLLHHAQGELAEAGALLQQALEVARELGHARLEAVVRCNLGIVDESRGAFDAAGTHYEAALAVARRLGDRRSEGQFLGHLGLMSGRCGRFDDARRQLECARDLLQGASDLLDLALVSCRQAEVEALAGDDGLAARHLAEAHRLAQAVDVEPASDLARALARVESMLRAA